MKKIIIDLETKIITGDKLEAIQGDNKCNNYIIKLIRDSEEIDLTGKQIRLAYERNGIGDIQDLTIIDNEKGEIEFELGGNLTKHSGSYNYQLAVFGENGYLENSIKFTGSIRESVFEKISTEIIESSSFDILTKSLKKVEEWDKNFNKWKNEIDAINIKEQERIESEKTRVNQENLRVTAEEERVAAERIRDEKVEKINSQCTKIENDFDEAIANVTNGNESATNSEIVQARGGEVNLNKRLDKFDTQLSDINKTKVIKAIDSTSLKANEKIDVEYLKFLQVQNYAEFYRKLRTGLPVNIASKGDSTVYGVDEYSDDKREPSTVTTDTGRTHVKTRASISYPEQLEINLRSIYGDKVSVENLGYSGSYAKFHYEQYFKKRSYDLALIMLGINDSKLPECPYAGDVKEFIYWYEQLIIRELIWGKAVIIMLPTRVRRVNDDIIDVFSNSLVLLAEKYNIPYVDTQSFFTNYNADIYSDNLHFNAKGYKVLASRVTAFIINEGLKNRKKIKDGSNIGIFETTDSIKYIGAAIQQASSGYTPYALDPATRSVLRFQNNSKAIYSFYAEDENLVIYPTVRLEANSSIKLTLDFGVQQAEVENITNIYGTTSTDNKFRNSYTLTSNSNSVLKFKDIYEKEAVKPLVITNKGWHTLLIETNGDVKLWGIEFKKFRNTKYKSLYRGEFYNVGDVITLNDKISSYDNLYIYANSLGFEGHLIDFNVSSVQDIRGINLSNDTDGTSVVFFELGFIKDNDIQIRITRNKQVSLVNGVQSLYNNPDENRIVEIFGVRYRD